jgi:hypothetical protein
VPVELFSLLVVATRDARPTAHGRDHRRLTLSITDPPPGRSPTDRFEKIQPCRENASPDGQLGFAIIRSAALINKLKQTSIENQPHQALSIPVQPSEIAQ